MTVSVIVPYRPGDEHRERLWDWCRAWWATWFPDYQVIVADTDHDDFNRGAARNRAARHATGEILIVADADTIAHPPAIAAGVAAVEDNQAPWVIPYEQERYYNLSESATRRRLQFPPDAACPIGEPWDEDDWEHKITSWAGCLIVRREAYWYAGGYPEFRTWGYEDDCFRAALDQLTGTHHRMDGFALHLWHPVTEDQRFGNDEIERNRYIARQYRRARSRQVMLQRIAQYGTTELGR